MGPKAIEGRWREPQIIGSCSCRQVPPEFGWIAIISKPRFGLKSKLVLSALAAGTYFVFVDSASSEGAFEITIEEI